jgi:hypothetical protein
MKYKKLLLIILLIIISWFTYRISKNNNLNPNFEIGQPIDSLNSVIVYYNGGVNHVEKRHTKDGYNLGLKYQCVEFVKRYYYEYLNHKMPDSYGHAKSFYDKMLIDGQLNTQRNLNQFSNPSMTKPQENDLIIMDKTIFNPFGHVAIISKITATEIEIIQQNAGAFSPSRVRFSLSKTIDGKWKIEQHKVLGWLRKVN